MAEPAVESSELRQLELIFDRDESARRKDAGMKVATKGRSDLLEEVRSAMRTLGATREVTADDAQMWLDENGHGEGALGNAMGSVFTGDHCWRHVGYAKSARPRAHSNLLRLWRYDG